MKNKICTIHIIIKKSLVQLILSASLIFASLMVIPVLMLIGCQTKTETYVSTVRHENGSLAAQVTYEKLNRDDLNNLLKNDPIHGLAIFYKIDGTIEHSGEWKHGVPWNGDCYVLEIGDAGSWGGLGRWRKFKEGKKIK